MDHIHKIGNAQNLLLNLLVRETGNWYFLEVVPRYDDTLADYMRSIVQKGFLRFDLPSVQSVIYFPLVYRSLTGMHIFGDKPVIRDLNTGSLSPLGSDKAISQLVSESFPGHAADNTDSLLEGLEARYTISVANALEKLLPDVGIKPSGGGTPQKSDATKRLVPAHELFSEHGDSNALVGLLEAITSCASGDGQSAGTAAIEWVKRYSILLIAESVSNYVSEDRTPSISLQHTEVGLDSSGYPVEISFGKGYPFILHRRLPEGFDRSKLEQHLLYQLLNLHLFPLVRAVGVLGLASEENALDHITDVFDGFHKQFQQELSFFGNVQTKVPAFLSDLLDTASEYTHRQVHVHNHTLNKAYYAHGLIKPAPGEMVHKRYFNGGTHEIGIRGFDIEKDLEVLHEWVNLEYAKKFWEMDGPVQGLEEHYIKHMGVDYSHPYIGTLNGEPIFTLELYWAIKDEVGKYYPFHPGDYGFHMLIAPAKQRIPNFSYYALTMCMEHFFSFGQVHRMIGEASVEHMGTHNLITKVGCEFDKALVLPYKTSNLTFLTREMYHEAAKEVLENSRTEILVNI